MGLDVYFYKKKDVRYPGDKLQTPEFYHRYANDEARMEMTKLVEELIVKVVNHKGDFNWEFMHEQIIPLLRLKYDDWLLNYIDPKKGAEEIIRWLFSVHFWRGRIMESAYFRKVNFICRYFSEKLVDESCIVTKAEIEDIIERCKKVLADHSLAKELLPTCDGFFFGSTDYDNWYFKDVEDCQKQMEKLLEDYDETTDVIWVDMSW